MVADLTEDTEFGWHGGSDPRRLSFSYPPIPGLLDALRNVFKNHCIGEIEDRSLRSLEETSGCVGRYAARGEIGKWFIRISKNIGDASLENEIIEHLSENGISVNSFILAGENFEFSGSMYRLDVRELIEGHHFEGDPADVRLLGEELKKCHLALNEFPKKEKISANMAKFANAACLIQAEAIEAFNSESWSYFGPLENWVKENPVWVKRWLHEWNPFLSTDGVPSCVHGEVHRGNVLFSGRERTPVLLDFEESVRLFVDPAWDLGYLVSRFCLTEKDPSARKQFLRAASDGYGGSAHTVCELIPQISYRAAGILLGRVRSGKAILLSEMEKFAQFEIHFREVRKEVEQYLG